MPRLLVPSSGQRGVSGRSALNPSAGVAFVASSAAALTDAAGAALGPDGFTWAQGKNPIEDEYGKLIAFVSTGSKLVPIVSNDRGATWTDPALTGFQNANTGEVGIRCALAYQPGAGSGYDGTVHALFIYYVSTDAATYYRRFRVVRDGSHNVTGVTKDAAINCILDLQNGAEPACASEHPVLLWQGDDPVGRPAGTLVACWGINEDTGSAVSATLRATMRVLTDTAADGVPANWRDLTGGAVIAATSAQKPECPVTEVDYVNPGVYAPWNCYPSMTRYANGNLAFLWGFTLEGVYYREAVWSAGTGFWPTLSTRKVGPKYVAAGATRAGYGLLHELDTDLHVDTVNKRAWFGMGRWVGDVAGDGWTVHYVDLADPSANNHDFAAGDPTTVYSAGAAQNGGSIFITGDVYWDDAAHALLVTATNLPNHDVLAYLYDAGRVLSDGPRSVYAGSPFDIPVIFTSSKLGTSPTKILIVGRDFNVEARQNPPVYSGGPYQGYGLTVSYS